MDTKGAPSGPVVTFGDADYRFGSGPMTLRVARVDWTHPLQVEGENWFEVEGVELAPDGREIGPRQALVRGRRLARLRQDAVRRSRPTEWRPPLR